MDKKKIRIDGERIYLRVLQKKDASEQYCKWLNDPEINSFLVTKKATVEELRKYIGEKLGDKHCLFFGIFLKENDLHIGNVKLEPIDFNNKKATVGIIVGEKKYQGKGLAPEVLKILVRWSFEILDLQEISLGVLSAHTRAIRAYKKTSFQIIGKDSLHSMKQLRMSIRKDENHKKK